MWDFEFPLSFQANNMFPQLILFISTKIPNSSSINYNLSQFELTPSIRFLP